jgi:hypothetical protein
MHRLALPALVPVFITVFALPAHADTQEADTIEAYVEGDATIVLVTRVRGIGGAQVILPRKGPQRVTLRFAGFADLESVKAKSGRGEFECVLIRPENRPAYNVCRLNGTEVEVFKVRPFDFEVRLPEALLSAPGDAAEVRWSDQPP